MKSEKNKSKTPWPTKVAMTQVYEKHLWGTNGSDFYSGEGSHLPELVEPYIAVLKSFLQSFKTPISVCDLGCGDFNIGEKLLLYSQKYTAVDIVSELIERNKINFKDEKLRFLCLDLAEDELPEGDCAILRQVLQHLSNAEIQQILSKLSAFKYLILTEHLPEGDFIPNEDIISGQGIRLKKKSGVVLTSPPFHFKIKKQEELLCISLQGNKGKLVTTLFEIS